MIQYYLPLSWHTISVCVALQVVCYGYCVYQWHEYWVPSPVLPREPQQSTSEQSTSDRGNPDGLIRVYAQMSCCRVKKSACGLSLSGSAPALMRFVCACCIAGISFTSYSLQPCQAQAHFCLRVAV